MKLNCTYLIYLMIFIVSSAIEVTSDDKVLDDPLKQEIFRSTLIKKYTLLNSYLHRNYESDKFNSKKLGKGLSSFLISEAKYFAHLAGLSYCDTETIEKNTCTHCKKLNGVYKVAEIYNEEYNLQAFILVDLKRNETIVSFRGARGITQAIELYGFECIPYANNDSLQVQKKIMKRTEAILPSILTRLNSTLLNYPHFRLMLVGHSLGGAMAVLSAPLIKRHFNLKYENIVIFTYGQPRVGSSNFIHWYNYLPLSVIRVVNSRDSITKMPYGKKFAHTRYELLIHDGAELCETGPADQDKCSQSYLSLPSPDLHKSVWGVQMGRKACFA